MKKNVAWCVLAVGVVMPFSRAAEKIDFTKQVKPILELHCLSCHGQERPKGGLRFTTREMAIEGGDAGPALVPGNPSESGLYTTTVLPADHDLAMPPKGPRLSKDETEQLRLWIEQGAEWPAEVVLKPVQKVDFVTEVQPILEFNCVSCHREGHAEGGLRLDAAEYAFKGGNRGPGIVPGDSAASQIYITTILPPDHPSIMPPKEGPLAKEETDILRRWIDEGGAAWPEGVTLIARKKEQAGQENAQLVQDIHASILAKLDVKSEAEMKPYKLEIPGTGVSFEMVPIKGGEFVMGSSPGDPMHKADEAPQHRVKVAPFWMGKFEVTWSEYELFMYPTEERKKRESLQSPAELHALADAVTRPTSPYVEMSFGMGKDGYPAISMTQHAANTYCKWLSAKLGQYYRLPTEAEWEYACRAGTTTAYSFGDDESKLGEYAWYADNSNFKYQKIGTKKPNPWGLHDMHGNVVEWCLDQYDPEAYKQFTGAIVENPWVKATEPYPHAVRGGSWDDDPDALRSAARRGSDRSWKMQDPQLPKSIWYHTDAQFLGFRIIRPLEVPAPEDLSKYWTSGVEKD